MKWPVFMYHTFSIAGVKPSGADLHYSIPLKDFSEHVNLCREHGISIISLLDYINQPNEFSNKKICFFTFDDGHVSNYDAAKILAENGSTGDFFINTSKIGHENYLSAKQLIEMKNMGMSIQTHGHEHKYFSELSEEQLNEQFEKSRNLLYETVGSEVKIFAPPGGRINRNIIRIAQKNGILLISNSRPGLFDKDCNFFNVPRLPIIHSTQIDDFCDYLLSTNHVILRLSYKYYISKILKIIMGNATYEKFRLFLLK